MNKVRVFIPDYYGKLWGDVLAETIAEAVKGICAEGASVQPAKGGSFLYLFSPRFPTTDAGCETPSAELWLSGSQGWKIKWKKPLKSTILTMVR